MGPQLLRLKYGVSESFSPGGRITGVKNTNITAKVQNVAFAKDVAIHYAQDDETCVEKPLAWQTTFGDYDLFARHDGTFVTSRFVIRYSVAGQSFWDNNDGVDYHVDGARPNVLGGGVVLNRATARRGSQAGGGFVFATSWVEGSILVKNLSFNKRLRIQLSPNGWASFQDTDASFGGAVPVSSRLSQVEVWKFKTSELNLDASHRDFAFAIFYNNLDTGVSHFPQVRRQISAPTPGATPGTG